ncbi:MAG: NAD(P)-dependent oxidoreductase [Planctomycetota bacterium]|nr:NAD(P)-dependent oxidoreductase [Planctomycetota bacterium]MEC8818991.1 NAD(P)-dependent oxidoreductase [Planctomycetota bacterium]
MKIAFLGTGIMGGHMAGHLLAAGHELTVFNRTRSKAEALISRGARWAESPRLAAEGQDVLISIVGMPDDVQEVYMGEQGVFGASDPPEVVIDMTTSTPTLARTLAEAATARGIASIDAPVSGGPVGAESASLSIMVGGDTDAVSRVWSLFESMGKTVIHQGGPGYGQHTKMVNQILLAGSMIGLAESMAYAEAAGLDPAKVISSIRDGAAGSRALTDFGPKILKGDFTPGFYAKHYLKDLGIALDEAARMDLKLPMLALVQGFYDRICRQGLNQCGTHVLSAVMAADQGSEQASRALSGLKSAGQ